MVIGGLPGVKYRAYELFLEPGSKLFPYTDGVPEATDANKQFFCMERTVAALNQQPDADSKHNYIISGMQQIRL